MAGYEDLVKEIKSLQEKEPQTIEGKSTKGGWHSHDYLHEDDKFSTLKSEIVNFFLDFHFVYAKLALIFCK